MYAIALTLGGARGSIAQDVHYGMNTRVLTAQMADKLVELGAGVSRVVFGWDVIEPGCKGCFNWATTDAWRDEARRTHRQIFATLAYAPKWANGGNPYWYPPLDYQDWYDFVYAAVTRYQNDIVLWGVWNEPNLDSYLKGTDLRVYQSLVVNARTAILSANRHAFVLGPEVSWHATTSGWYETIMSTVGDLFDIVTVHWYADGPPLGRMMDDLVEPFTQGKPVWLTEAGKRPCDSFFGEAGQALFYQQVLDAFQPRRDWWTGLLFFDLWEQPVPPDCGSAITREDWSNRPAFTLFRRFIANNP